MRKLTISHHLYSLLIAGVTTAIAFLFNPGIPWFAWVGAFGVLFLTAEVFCLFLSTEGQETGKVKKQTLGYFAIVAAMILTLVAVGVYFFL